MLSDNMKEVFFLVLFQVSEKKIGLKDERHTFLYDQTVLLHFSSMIVCHIDGEGTNWVKTFHLI